MLKCCKNCNGIYLKGNRLAIFMEFSQSVEQNHTVKLRNTLSFLLFLQYPLLPDCLHKCLHQGKKEGTTAFRRRLFSRPAAHFHYNSSLQIIKKYFQMHLKALQFLMNFSKVRHQTQIYKRGVQKQQSLPLAVLSSLCISPLQMPLHISFAACHGVKQLESSSCSAIASLPQYLCPAPCDHYSWHSGTRTAELFAGGKR